MFGQKKKDYPVVREERDLEELSHHSQAYVLLEATWVRPIYRLVQASRQNTSTGRISRGLELFLVGWEEGEPRLVEEGLAMLMVEAAVDPRGGMRW